MNTKLRYEPPLLVDMKGPDLCGELMTCGSGGSASYASCYESSSCRNGRGAERCQAGNYACGCDACCETGTSWSSSSGLPFTGCECIWGNQAKEHCSDGQWAGGPCLNGYYASYNCTSGTNNYSDGTTNWCVGGSS